MILLFFLIMQTGLELPEVTIYGEKGKKEIVKGSLLSDSVHFLPELGVYIPSLKRLRAKESPNKRIYTAKIDLWIGNLSRAGIFGGFKEYTASLLYHRDCTRDGFEISVGMPYLSGHYENILFEGEIFEERYKNRGMGLSFYRKNLSINGDISYIDSGGGLFSIDTRYNNPFWYINGKAKIYKGGDFIVPFSLGCQLNRDRFSFSPSLFFSFSDDVHVYPGISFKWLFSCLDLSFAYSPYATIIDRRELVSVNPFTVENSYKIRTGDLIELKLGSNYGYIKAGYQENYPMFDFDSSGYFIKKGEVYFIKGYGDIGFATLKMEYRHNVSVFMPYFSFVPDIRLNWERFCFVLSCESVQRKDPGNYILPRFMVSYEILQGIFVLSKIGIPYGETVRWKGAKEDESAFYFGVKLNI